MTGSLAHFFATQLQVSHSVVGIDIQGGQVFLTNYDRTFKKADPRDPTSTALTIFPFSVPKDQMGVNAGIVYHMTPSLHWDLDFFRAQADWYAVNGFAGAKQVVWVGNGGMTLSW